jgi:hypothetical protein
VVGCLNHDHLQGRPDVRLHQVATVGGAVALPHDDMSVNLRQVAVEGHVAQK